MANKYRPLVSVIVAAKNEEGKIGKFLNSVRNQTYKNLETIVVDGHSKDRTRDIAKNMGAKVVLETGKHRSLPNARNIGINVAKGQITGVFDADSEFEPTFFEEAVKKFKDPKVFGVAFKTDVLEDTFLERVRKTFVVGSESMISSPQITRKSYRDKDMWDPSLGFGEDRDYLRRLFALAKRKKVKMVIADKALMHFHVTHGILDTINQQRWYGRTLMKYLKKSGSIKEWFTYIRIGYVLIPLALVLPFYWSDVLAVIVSPFVALTLYHTVNAIRKGGFYGIFVPLLDFLFGVGLLIGILESIISEKVARE